MKALGVTHVLSILNIKPDPSLLPMTQFVVEALDEPSFNLIQHFPATNRFIKNALNAGGGVFVHWYECRLTSAR